MSAAWEKPLAGVRVLDFAHVLAGPLCTALLGVLGAEVYKVESWARLDGTRRKRLSDPPPSREEVGSHRAFQIMNHDKLGVSLNLQEPEGQALAGRLAEECDVLVEAWRPGVAARFGLDYESVRALNPRIVMLSLSGSGQYGPEAQYAMYAAIFAALGGLTHITGYPDGVPTEYRGSIDYRTGFEALLAVLTGLHRREQTDEGCYIDLAGREVCANLIGDAFVELQATGREPGREGNVDRVMSPHGVYETAEQDSWVALAIGSDDEWRAFCAAGPLPALAEDARFADGFRRWQHREELDALVRAWVRIQAAEPLIARLQAAGVPACLSARFDQLLGDEHLHERGAIFQRVVEGVGQVTIPTPPWRFEGSAELLAYGPAPGFAEHNERTFKGLLGLSCEEYCRLRDSGVIA